MWKLENSIVPLLRMGCEPVLSLRPSGSATYTTSSLSTKTTTASDPPNICKVKPQQLQGGSLSSSSFSQLGCVPPLLPQQQQTPQVYVSQSAAGKIKVDTQFFCWLGYITSQQHSNIVFQFFVERMSLTVKFCSQPPLCSDSSGS